MKKILKRLCTGVLAFMTVVTALPSTPVHASETQYWTESDKRVGIVERVNNDGSMILSIKLDKIRKRVENDYTFTADGENMEVQINFTFDASELSGQQLVIFEELYDISNLDEPKKVRSIRIPRTRDRRYGIFRNIL